jgi:hypothetical protein
LRAAIGLKSPADVANSSATVVRPVRCFAISVTPRLMSRALACSADQGFQRVESRWGPAGTSLGPISVDIPVPSPHH